MSDFFKGVQTTLLRVVQVIIAANLKHIFVKNANNTLSDDLAVLILFLKQLALKNNNVFVS